jgi:hypothetical protein
MADGAVDAVPAALLTREIAVTGTADLARALRPERGIACAGWRRQRQYADSFGNAK